MAASFECPPSIAEFYAERSIFITGATGFLGKVLMEKILRCCKDVSTIYVLIRPRKGLDARQRLEQLISSKLFDQLREQQPNFSEKIQPLTGDILMPGLGLSASDEELIKSEVSVVFHSAATVRFDEPLKISVDMNVKGTQRVIDLVKKITKIEAFIHISTAYANCNQTYIDELIYPPPIHPTKLLDAVEWMDEEVLEALTPKMLMDRPNTYTYTKSMAEFIVSEQCRDIPTAIIRPSIIGASWKDPIPGWVDNFNGPSGIIAAMGKGILRSMIGNRDMTADILPVDIAVNMLIATAWHTAVHKPEVMKIFNSTTGQLNRCSWGEVEELLFKFIMKHPVSGIIRVPNPRFTHSRIWYELNKWMDHLVPAYVMDLFMWITHRKPVFVKVQDKLIRAVKSLEYFTSHEWEFSNDNMFMLLGLMSKEDKQMFNFDVRDMDWEGYLENYMLGVREFVLKDDPRKTSLAKEALKRLQRINACVNFVTIFVLWRLVMTRVKIANTAWYSMINIIMKLFNTFPAIFQS